MFVTKALHNSRKCGIFANCNGMAVTVAVGIWPPYTLL